uniref:restriction endonuclease subunit S n=1 Tax=Mariniflexile sp. TaxID=1979402 RepID=UPI004048D151
MRKDWTECCFEDLLDYEQPTKYIVKSTKYSDSYKMPVLTAGKSFIKGYTNETDGIFENLPTIIFDDFTTATQYVNFKFKVKSSAMKILVPTSKLVNMPLVYYAMQVNQVRSDTHKRYWISVFAKKNFLLPPLVEQKAIVKRIEELFSSLDSGIADLKKVQEQLVIYRHAVLKKAFEGEYNINKLGKLAIVKRGKSKHRPRNDKSLFGGKYPFIQTGEIRATNGGIITKYTNTYSEKGLAQSKLWPKGTLCLTVAANIGETAFLGFDACFPDSVVGIKPNDELLNPRYLNFYIQKIKEEMDSKASATAQKNINVRILDALEIPVPTLKEQHQIVQEIESRLSVCDKVEESIKESLEKAIALRQSILKKAFGGTLLSAAEIEQCKQHKDYEPASVLLEKIRAEKLAIESTTKKSKPRKKKTIKKKPPVKISTDIQAGVIAKVIQFHENNPKHLTHLTHVKCEKISHLVEYHLQIPLGRVPVKDAAGPDDYNHLKKVEHRAGMAGYFNVVKKEIGHTYSSSRNIAKAIDNLESKVTAEQKKQLDNLINLFLKFDLERAEIIATLYAGWNNLLIDGKTPTDDEIVYESRENWSKRKLTIKRERFYKALQWMRKDEIGLVPIGFGTKVLKPIKQK